MPHIQYKHPVPGVFGTCVEAVANATAIATCRRHVFSRLPFLELMSDVVDITYMTWLVPVEKAKLHAPSSVRLQQHEGLTPFTILTYAHQHFGPARLGALRSICPSPLQSNWRFYLSKLPLSNNAPSPTGKTVYFTHNAFDSLLYVVGARIFSDALPAHLPARFTHTKIGNTYRTQISSGSGSAPALDATLQLTEQEMLPPVFQSIYGSWTQAVTDLALQDAAIVDVPGQTRLAYAQIDLPIDVAQTRPAQLVPGHLACPFIEQLTPIGEPLCFIVPRVPFRVLSERLL